MTPIENILSRLERVTDLYDGNWSALCPAHNDNNPSLSIAQAKDGRVLVKCHADCETKDVVEAMGLSMGDLFSRGTMLNPRTKAGATIPMASSPKPPSKPSGTAYPTPEAAIAEMERHHNKSSQQWAYQDITGTTVGYVVRWDLADGKKDYRPVSRHAGGWYIAAMPEPRPLYGLVELMMAKRVVITEGEKAADRARIIGLTTTTSVGGASAPKHSDWWPLAGKEVWILPDNDAPGRKYADTVSSILTKLTPPATVKIIELPGLPDHGDIVEWCDAHGYGSDPASLRAELEALADAVDSETMPECDDSFQPFPIDALPDPVGPFVRRAATAIGCDPSYVALPLLTAIAAAIGTTRKLELKAGWTVPSILWGAIVGESGTMKSPALNLATRLIRERQFKALSRHVQAMTKYEATLARWERDIAVWKKSKDTSGDPPVMPEPPACERCMVSDTTVEALAPILSENPRGLLLNRDELAGWIGSFDRYAGKGKAGTDSPNWLSMFSAEAIVVDRKSGEPRTIVVPQAAVCVIGGIQPGVLRRALGDAHRESGLAARLLLAFPPWKAKKWTDNDIDLANEAGLAQLFDRLYELQPTKVDGGDNQPVLVRPDPAAKAAWTAYYDSHAAEQADLTGDQAAAWAKLEEYAARLAFVIHFARWAASDPTLVDAHVMDVASMEAGICLAKWFKREARRVYAMLAETDIETDQRHLLEWIDRKGGSVSVRETQQGYRRLKDPGAAEAALDFLVKSGCGKWEDVGLAPKRGRPSRRFCLGRNLPAGEVSLQPE